MVATVVVVVYSRGNGERRRWCNPLQDSVCNAFVPFFALDQQFQSQVVPIRVIATPLTTFSAVKMHSDRRGRAACAADAHAAVQASTTVAATQSPLSSISVKFIQWIRSSEVFCNPSRNILSLSLSPLHYECRMKWTRYVNMHESMLEHDSPR